MLQKVKTRILTPTIKSLADTLVSLVFFLSNLYPCIILQGMSPSQRATVSQALYSFAPPCFNVLLRSSLLPAIFTANVIRLALKSVSIVLHTSSLVFHSPLHSSAFALNLASFYFDFQTYRFSNRVQVLRFFNISFL